MSNYSDFLNTLRDWTNRQDTSDAIVGGWVTMAEDRFNVELRCREMVKRATATVTNNAVPLPTACLDLLYLRYVPDPSSSTYSKQHGKTFQYATVDEYWTIVNDLNHPMARKPLYTRIANSLELNPNVDTVNGTTIEIGYHSEVDPFATTLVYPPVYLRHPRLYLYASLAASAAYLVEDDRIPTWEAQATALLQTITAAYSQDKYSGSPLHTRRKSFG